MKNWIKENWALIGFLLAFALDTQFGLLEAILGHGQWSNIIRGLGAIVLAYYWNNNKSNRVEMRGIGARPPKRTP
jgi:phosphotransferase system  glucose/maltose/N-acetylglucosamine-specific IIC component